GEGAHAAGEPATDVAMLDPWPKVVAFAEIAELDRRSVAQIDQDPDGRLAFGTPGIRHEAHLAADGDPVGGTRRRLIGEADVVALPSARQLRRRVLLWFSRPPHGR